MPAIPPVTAKKLAAIHGDFLAGDPAQQLESVREIRARRRKPTVIIKAKKIKEPKSPKVPKPPKAPKPPKDPNAPKKPRKPRKVKSDVEVKEDGQIQGKVES